MYKATLQHYVDSMPIVGLGLLSATAQADALLNRMRFGRELERGLCLSSENAHSVRGIRRAEGDRLISRNDVTEISEVQKRTHLLVAASLINPVGTRGGRETGKATLEGF